MGPLLVIVVSSRAEFAQIRSLFSLKLTQVWFQVLVFDSLLYFSCILAVITLLIAIKNHWTWFQNWALLPDRCLTILVPSTVWVRWLPPRFEQVQSWLIRLCLNLECVYSISRETSVWFCGFVQRCHLIIYELRITLASFLHPCTHGWKCYRFQIRLWCT